LGWKFSQDFSVDNPNKFYASVNYYAGYASFEFSMLKDLKAVLGARYESYMQFYTGSNRTREIVLDNEKVLDNTDIFPSVNVIYTISQNMSLRGSYSKTIARPSFKELSYAVIIDPISEISFVGGLDEDVANIGGEDVVVWDGNLKSSDIQNFDIRWEWFHLPGNNMISLSAYYKAFENPIELVQYSRTQKTWVQPRNVGNAIVYGTEVELRQDLGLIIPSLTNINFIGNYTYAYSQILMSQTEKDAREYAKRTGQVVGDYRVMAGQAPHIINIGISFDGGANGFFKGSEAGFFYNVQGRTLEVVGIADRPDIYTKPFHSLNFNSNTTFGSSKRLSAGFKVNNILNNKKQSYYNSFDDNTSLYNYFESGITFSASIKYKFL